MSTSRKAIALFPMQVSPMNFSVGDHVRKLAPSVHSEAVTVGVVTHLFPKSGKVGVQWPYGNTRESPEEIYKVDPKLFPATVTTDSSYSSWEGRESEKNYGSIGKRPQVLAKVAANISHRYLDKVSGILLEITRHKEANVPSLQAYLKLSSTYSKDVGDTFLKALVYSVYGE